MSLQGWKEEVLSPSQLPRARNSLWWDYCFACLLVSFKYLNMNGSTVPVTSFSFNKKICRTFPFKSTFFKTEAFERSAFIKQLHRVSLRSFANNSGFPILFWHNSSSNVMKINATLCVSKREPYKWSCNRRYGNGLFLISLFWLNFVYCFFSTSFPGQFLIPNFINIQHTNVLGKTMENSQFIMVLSSISKVANMPEGVFKLAWFS